jgi:hypothetical protein
MKAKNRKPKTGKHEAPVKSTIIDDAISLPAEQRALLVDVLIQSLNLPLNEDVDHAWVVEAKKRWRELNEGKVLAIPADKVLDEIRKRFGR